MSKLVHYEVRHCFVRCCVLTLLLAVVSFSSFAQVATTYSFSQYQGTYVPLTSSTPLDSSSYTGSLHDTLILVNIPQFRYDGTLYSQMYVHSSGQILLSNVNVLSPANYGLYSTNYYPFTLGDSANYICPFSTPLTFDNTGGTISWAVVGQEIVVQWKGMKRYGGSGTASSTEVLNFQVRLNRNTGSITFVYDSVAGSSTVVSYPEVGIRGLSANFYRDVNCRTITHSGSWSNSQPGVIGIQYYLQMQDNPPFPTSGQTYVWTKAACPTVYGTSLISATQTTANLIWDSISLSPLGYIFKVVPIGQPASSTAIYTGFSTTSSGTAHNLTAATDYTVYIASVCGAGDTSVWSYGYDFGTLCNAVTTLPWTEGFEGLGTNIGYNVGPLIFPPCWLPSPDTIGTYVTAWNSQSSYLSGTPSVGAHSGIHFITHTYSQHQNSIYTPAFQLTAGQAYEFYFYYATQGSVPQPLLRVAYGNAQASNSSSTFIGPTLTNVNTNGAYQKFSAIFTPATSGSYYFATIDSEAGSGTLALDDYGLREYVPCTGLPTQGVISGASSACSYISTTLTVSGYSLYTHLQWQSSPDSLTWTNIANDTFETATVSISALTYYRVKVICSDSSYTAAFPLSLTPTALCYCTNGLGGNCSSARMDTLRILNTAFNNNYVLCNTSNGGYTSFPDTGSNTTILKRGVTYQLYGHFTDYAITSMWIDYNQNHLYDTTEWVQLSTNAMTGLVSFTVPLTATLGRTGMRIRSRTAGSTNGNSNACTNFTTGETFDFIIKISDSLLDCSHHPVVSDANTSATCGSVIGNINETVYVSTIYPLNTHTYYQHHWSSGDTTSVLLNKPLGSYTDTITFNGGCKYVAPADTIKAIAPLSYHLDSTKNEKCFGGSVGAIYLSVSGGSGSYTHKWNNGSTAAALTSVGAGSYTDTIRDATYGCVLITSPIAITQPSTLVINLDSVKSISCAGNGGIYISVSGGTTAYSYLWSGGGFTGQDLVTTIAGGYTVSVTDHNACSVSFSDTIQQSVSSLSAHLDSVKNAKCYGSANGVIYLTISGGSGTYNHKWSNGSTAALLTAAAGSYTDTVVDAVGGCRVIAGPYTISQPVAILVSRDSVRSLNCDTTVRGGIYISVSGGTPGYTYLWSGAGYSGQDLVTSSAGIYTVTVSDHNACTSVFTDTVKQIGTNGLSLHLDSANNVKCNGQNTASIYVSATGGNGTLHFLWSNNATATHITSLGAGSYTVTVTDANGCHLSLSETISQPALLSTPSIISNQTHTTSGAITITTTGGTAPYHYHWSNGDSTASINGLTAGVYAATITDANGCIATVSDTVKLIPTGIGEIAGANSLTVSPNPTSGHLTISISLGNAGSVEIDVFSVTGQSIYHFGQDNVADLTKTIDLSQAAAGIYLVRMKAADQYTTKRVSIVK